MKILISSSEVIEELRKLGRPAMSPGYGDNGWGSEILWATSEDTYSEYKCSCVMHNSIYPKTRDYPTEFLEIDFSGKFPSAKPQALGDNERYYHGGFRNNGSKNPKDWTPLVSHWHFTAVVQGIWISKGFWKTTTRFLCKCTLCDTYSMVLASPFDHKKDAKCQMHESPVEWQTSQEIIEETVSKYEGLCLIWDEPVILPKNEDGSVPQSLFNGDDDDDDDDDR